MKEELSNIELIKDLIIGFSALTGMVLGIFNLMRSINKDKVKLKIIPKSVMGKTRNSITGGEGYMIADSAFSDSLNLFAYEIINKSDFPVVIDEIGFKVKGTNDRMIVFSPISNDRKGLPREIKPRNSVTLYSELNSLREKNKIHPILKAYVKTACGITCYGNSKALKLLKKYLRRSKN